MKCRQSTRARPMRYVWSRFVATRREPDLSFADVLRATGNSAERLPAPVGRASDHPIFYLPHADDELALLGDQRCEGFVGIRPSVHDVDRASPRREPPLDSLDRFAPSLLLTLTLLGRYCPVAISPSTTATCWWALAKDGAHGTDAQRLALRRQHERRMHVKAGRLARREIAHLSGDSTLGRHHAVIMDHSDATEAARALERCLPMWLKDRARRDPRVIQEPIEPFEFGVGPHHLRERSSRVCRRCGLDP